MRISVYIFVSLLCLGIGWCRPAEAAACANSLQLSAMNSEWARALYQRAQRSQTSVAVLPFTPVLAHAQVPPYFPYAFPILLADYWPPSSPVNMVDWRLVNQAMNNVSVSVNQTFQGGKALAVGDQLKVRYLITGSFDLYQGRLKAYVRYYDMQTRSLVDKANLTVESRLDASFLLLINEIAQGAGKAFPRVGVDKGLATYLMRSVRRYEAVLDYIQGVTNTAVYDPNRLSVAKVWLKNAIGKDYQFHQAYRELARVHYMLGLIDKERLLNAGTHYLEGDRVLQQAAGYAYAGARPQDFLERYVRGQLAFMTGLNAFNRRDYVKAAEALEGVRAMLPEDGLAQYYLSLAHQSNNRDDLAKTPWATANQINPCFKDSGIGLVR